MFFKNFVSNSQRQAKLVESWLGLTSPSGAQPVTAKQAGQVAGGCSNPRGCTSLNEGIALVTLRRQGVSDFQDRHIESQLPNYFSL